MGLCPDCMGEGETESFIGWSKPPDVGGDDEDEAELEKVKKVCDLCESTYYAYE